MSPNRTQARPAAAGRSPYGQKSASEKTDLLLRERAAPELRRLLDRNCDRAELVARLGALRHHDPSLDELKFWTSRTRKQIKATIGLLEKCATAIEALDAQRIRVIAAGVTGRSDAALFPLLTATRACAAMLRGVLAEVSGRKHLSCDLLLASVVRYVRDCTGHFHDREVSAMIGAVLGKVYTTENHKQWRTVNYPRLAGILQQMAEHRASERAGGRSAPTGSRKQQPSALVGRTPASVLTDRT